MTMENFLSYLQQLLSMVSMNNRESVVLAEAALENTIALAVNSGKVDPVTLRAMRTAQAKFRYLMIHKDDFEGKPGQYLENRKRRQRLSNVIVPGC